MNKIGLHALAQRELRQSDRVAQVAQGSHGLHGELVPRLKKIVGSGLHRVENRSASFDRLLYPRFGLEGSKGFLLPADHSSLWFRVSTGASLAADRTQPFARFYFGGFANNWVDHRGIKQFRNTESFPGIEINQVDGATYGKAQVEWMSPPLRFRSIGIPSAYLRWAGLTLFANALVTDFDSAAERRSVGSVGAQVDVRLITLSHLESTFSVGFAVAEGQGIPRRRSLMASCKLM